MYSSAYDQTTSYLPPDEWNFFAMSDLMTTATLIFYASVIMTDHNPGAEKRFAWTRPHKAPTILITGGGGQQNFLSSTLVNETI